MYREISIDRRTLAVVVVALLVGTLALASVATPVAAHAYLSESDPSNGEQVEDTPDEVTLYFSGDGVVNADITVTGPDGEAVGGDPEIDADDTQIVRVPIEDAGDGMYIVDWEVLADDGHTTSGAFFFAVGDEPLDRDAVLETYEDDEDDDAISPGEAGSKALLLVGLVGLVGIPVAAAVAVYPAIGRVSGSSARRAVDRRLDGLLGGATALVTIGVFGLGIERSTNLGSLSVETVGDFLTTPLGQIWLVQLAILGVLLALVTGLRRAVVSRRASLAAVTVAGIALAGTVGWSSHSATAIDRLQGTALDFVHIAGAGLWVGGLLVLAVVVPAALRETAPGDRAALAAATVQRYSVLALAGVTLAAATGLVLAGWHVPTVEGLSETAYGLTLSAKTLLVLVALGLGGLTRFVLLRRLDPAAASDGTLGRLLGWSGGDSVRGDGGESTATARFSRAVRIEAVVLVLVVVLSGLLTSAPTAAVAGLDDGPEEATVEFEQDDHVIELAVLPVAEVDPEVDDFVVTADEPLVFDVTFEQDGTTLQSDQSVRLLAEHLDGDTTFEVELEETEDGSYAVVQPLPADGDWDLRLTGAPDGAYTAQWISVHALPADGAHDDHAHDDHDDHAHDHDGPEAGQSDGDDEPTPFTATLQFGAVAIFLVGTGAVVVESIRFRDRSS